MDSFACPYKVNCYVQDHITKETARIKKAKPHTLVVGDPKWHMGFESTLLSFGGVWMQSLGGYWGDNVMYLMTYWH